MITAAHVQPATTAMPAQPQLRSAADAGPSLLPAPTPLEKAALSDALSLLYLSMSEDRDTQMYASKELVHNAANAREAAAKFQEEQLRKAREAAEEGGFFDWVADDLGIAGAIGLVTFNYAAVAADVAAHKLHLLDDVKIDVIDVGAAATGRVDVLAGDVVLRKTDIAPEEARRILERAGIPKDAPGISDADVKPVAKKLLMANLALLGLTASVMSGGSTTGICIALAGVAISAGGSYVAQEGTLDPVFGQGTSKWIGLGMQVYGSLAAGLACMAPGPSVFAQAARVTAAAAQGATNVMNGSDQVVTSIHEHTRAMASIEADEAKARLAKLDRFLDCVMDTIQEARQSRQKACDAIRSAREAYDQSALALASGMRG
jgi:hypothetical protein